MHTLAFFSVIAAIGFIIWCLFGVLTATGRRRLKLKQAGWGCIGFFAALIFLVQASDQAARKEGVEDMAEKAEGDKGESEAAAARASDEARETAAREERARQDTIAEAARQLENERNEKEAAAACLTDLSCIWKDQSIDIGVECRIAVQGLAKWDYEWTDGWSAGPAFTLAGWHKKDEGSIMLAGKQLKLQNALGAWKHVSYLCAYNPKTRQVIEAAVL